jgi:hypothetical protein
MSLSASQEVSPAPARDHVLIPAKQAAVFEAIRDKGKTGNPQAVREYREWLTRLQLVSGDHDQKRTRQVLGRHDPGRARVR